MVYRICFLNILLSKWTIEIRIDIPNLKAINKYARFHEILLTVYSSSHIFPILVSDFPTLELFVTSILDLVLDSNLKIEALLLSLAPTPDFACKIRHVKIMNMI